MPSTSKSQQRLMGQAYAYKKGELKSSEVSAEIKELADSMTLKQLKDFASTKHDGLPERVPENLGLGSLNGMGPVTLPAGETLGSGDIPAGSGDAEEEYKKKKRKPGVELMTFEKFTKTNMKHINTFESFTFDYQDIDIRNPFTDETARMDVDPDGYYGKDYAKSDIKKIVDATENFIAKYTEWKDYAPLDADEDLHADYGDYVKPSLDELVRIVKKHG